MTEKNTDENQYFANFSEITIQGILVEMNAFSLHSNLYPAIQIPVGEHTVYVSFDGGSLDIEVDHRAKFRIKRVLGTVKVPIMIYLQILQFQLLKNQIIDLEGQLRMFWNQVTQIYWDEKNNKK